METFKRSKYCLFGIPDHQGVVNVGGRIGAAKGPLAFRKIFFKMSGVTPIFENLNDLGDLDPISTDVGQNHAHAARSIEKAYSLSDLSIIVGGGHDHGYSHLKGIFDALKKEAAPVTRTLGCINIDAHLDVRKPSPKISSGSPFFLAIESGVLDPALFIEFGIQSHCNSKALYDYVQKKKVNVIPWVQIRKGSAVKRFEEELTNLSSKCDAVVISLDMDAMASAYSPGVSAPQSEGFASNELIEMMEIAGRHKGVISLGIFELNPEHDRDDQTARLAATAAYHFMESFWLRN